MNNFISAEEFLKQDEKVQKVFLDWWKPQRGDLFSPICPEGIGVLNGTEKSKEYLIPLLQMRQLIQFVEDKISGKLDIDYYYDTGYDLCAFNCDNKCSFSQLEIKKDLLHALWQVAIQIAKESA